MPPNYTSNKQVVNDICYVLLDEISKVNYIQNKISQQQQVLVCYFVWKEPKYFVQDFHKATRLISSSV